MRNKSKSPFFNTPEAAEYLRLRPATLEHWRSIGGGPPYRKLGRRVVYAMEDLERFADERQRSSTSDRGGLS
jgi:DNA-binding transcriptional MerR regulator